MSISVGTLNKLIESGKGPPSFIVPGGRLRRFPTEAVRRWVRGGHKLHLFQAISYAGMIAKWTSDDLLQLLSPDRQEALEGFLDVELEEINRKQRIILVAEAEGQA